MGNQEELKKLIDRYEKDNIIEPYFIESLSVLIMPIPGGADLCRNSILDLSVQSFMEKTEQDFTEYKMNKIEHQYSYITGGSDNGFIHDYNQSIDELLTNRKIQQFLQEAAVKINDDSMNGVVRQLISIKQEMKQEPRLRVLR